MRKNQRLTRKLFINLRGPGRFFHTTHFSLRTTQDPSGPKVGVSASKKVSKLATTRNRTRRRAYAVITKLLPNLEKKLYLISVKPGGEKLKGESLKQELAELLKKG